MMQNSIKVSLAAAVACGLLSANAAEQIKWTGGATGDWNTDSNWSGESKPTTDDFALFSGKDQERVTFTSESSPIAVGGILMNKSDETVPMTVAFDLGKDGKLTTSSAVNTTGDTRSGTWKGRSHVEFLSGLFDLGWDTGTSKGHYFTLQSLDTDAERSSYLISGANTVVTNFSLRFGGTGGRVVVTNGAQVAKGAFGPWQNANNKKSVGHQFLFTGAGTHVDGVSIGTKTGDASFDGSRVGITVADGAVATNMTFTIGSGTNAYLEVAGKGSHFRGSVTYWGRNAALIARDGGRLDVTTANNNNCQPTNFQVTVSGKGSRLTRSATGDVTINGVEAFAHFDNTDGWNFPYGLIFNNPDTRFSGGDFENGSWKAFTCGKSWSDARLAITNDTTFHLRQALVVGAGADASRNAALIAGSNTMVRMWNNLQVGFTSPAGGWSHTCDNEVRISDGAHVYLHLADFDASFPTISATDRVRIWAGNGRGSCRNRVVIENGAVVTNAGMVVVGGGLTTSNTQGGAPDYTNGGGSLNAFIVSNATYVGKTVSYVNGTTVTGLAPEDVRADEGSYSNRIEVLDGAYASIGGELRLSYFGTKSETTPDALEYTGGAQVHVRNASLLVTSSVTSRRPDHVYGSDEIFVEGDAASFRMSDVGSAEGTTTPLLLHWGIDGSTVRDPELRGMIELTTSYGGVTRKTWDDFAFKLDIGKDWSQRPRRDYIDLMSANYAHSGSLRNLADKLNADPGVQAVLKETGCRIAYVAGTSTSGTAVEDYRVRLYGGGRGGLMLLLR